MNVGCTVRSAVYTPEEDTDMSINRNEQNALYGQGHGFTPGNYPHTEEDADMSLDKK